MMRGWADGGRGQATPVPLQRQLAVLSACLAFTLLLSSCSWLTERSRTARYLAWRDADMGDIHRFPARPIPAGEGEPFHFHVGAPTAYDTAFVPLVLQDDESADTIPFDTFLETRSTWAFVVARRDTILYERYFAGRTGDGVETTFSVSKSLVSIAAGLALDRGLIEDVQDPVTRYVPELAERDPRFDRVTLHHLLTMSAGIRFDRGKMPWGDEARSYYDPDLRSVALSVEIDSAPGARFEYNFYNPIVLGLALERATGMSLSDFLAEGLWSRIGAESDASWSLDSRRHGFEKMESGFNAPPRDLLRLGRLFLHRGEWNGERVLSADWVDASVRADSVSDPSLRYGYFWWVNPVEGRTPSYFAEGRFGQFVYVVPDLELVMVRTGGDDGDMSWPSVFERVARRVEEVDGVGR